jgi:hypothetical protein
MKMDKMSKICNTHGEFGKYIQNVFVGKPQGKWLIGDLSSDGKII